MRLTLRQTVGTRMQWPLSQYTSPRSCICGLHAARLTERHTLDLPKCMSRIVLP